MDLGRKKSIRKTYYKPRSGPVHIADFDPPRLPISAPCISSSINRPIPDQRRWLQARGTYSISRPRPMLHHGLTSRPLHNPPQPLHLHATRRQRRLPRPRRPHRTHPPPNQLPIHLHHHLQPRQLLPRFKPQHQAPHRPPRRPNRLSAPRLARADSHVPPHRAHQVPQQTLRRRRQLLQPIRRQTRPPRRSRRPLHRAPA